MRERLYRSRSDRMLFGVAGGMARHLDLDPAIVRIVWALLVLAVGAGLLLYVIAAIVIPEEPLGWASTAGSSGADGAGGGTVRDAAGAGVGGAAGGRSARRDGNGAVLIGIALVLVGGWVLLQRFIPAIDTDVVWPVLLVVLGGALVVGALRR